MNLGLIGGPSTSGPMAQLLLDCDGALKFVGQAAFFWDAFQDWSLIDRALFLEDVDES